MRIIKTIAVLLIGASLLLTACGGTSGGSPPATPPAANTTPAVNPTPATVTTPAPTVTAASFTTSNLTVTPDKAKPGDRVMVGVTVTNTGMQQGTYSVVAKDHNGTLLGTKDVTLGGGAKEDVNLQISINVAGTHMIMIDNLYQNLLIEDAAPASTQPVAIQPPSVQGTGPAAFTLSNLVLGGTMMPNDKVTIGVTVTNTGGQSGTYKVVLKIQNDQTKTEDTQTQDVTVAGGASQKVTFTVIAGPDGYYTVVIGTLKGTLVVGGTGGGMGGMGGM